MTRSARQKGQSLIEVIVALVVLGVIVVGLARVIVNSLRNAEYSRNKNLSLHLAQTKMEGLRKQRDSTNWDVFQFDLLKGGTEFRETEILNEDGSYNSVSGKYTRVTQYLDASESAVDIKIKVTITVSWTDSQGDHSVEIKDIYLSKWN